MEPTVDVPNIGPEQPSAPETSSPKQQPEAAPGPQPERKAERAPSPENAPGIGQGMVLPAVQPPTDDRGAAAHQTSTATATDDMPLIADDVDVIEMEWVNKAKQIIKDTKADPHAQEAAVEKLQREYLKKRYGKELQTSQT
ncbi:hypothetical protein HY441_00010 [Candidatus Microgenomates bacterium]|nr:hypothetical protein [Candidatus Microgenomates bacterium]